MMLPSSVRKHLQANKEAQKATTTSHYIISLKRIASILLLRNGVYQFRCCFQENASHLLKGTDKTGHGLFQTVAHFDA